MMNKRLPPIPVSAFPRVVWRRILREVRARTAPDKPRPLFISDHVRELARGFRERRTPRFFGLMPEQSALVARFYPDAWRSAVAQADRIRAHRFDLFGSGEVNLGPKIDWHTDFKSGYTWPLEHFTRLKLSEAGGGFDVKVPWELSRFHHAIRLGQAYQYTLDEFYAREVTGQIADWIARNPCEFGINWAGPMDVAIRAVNWLWAYYLIIESAVLTPDFIALFLSSLWEHGNYLLKHLEDGWPRTNHLVANLAGLAYLGILLPEFAEAARWRSVGLTRLWAEIERQVYPDGLHYEASLPYHRLVTEMALSVAGLCVMNGITIPDAARHRLAAMLDAVMAYTRPDGTAPCIGDADDGRLHPLAVSADPDRAASDHRHLLGLGSLVLERQLREWAGYVNPSERGWALAAQDEWQDALWCFASDAAARLTDTLTHCTGRPASAQPDDWIEVRKGIRVRARALAEQPLKLEEVTGSRAFPLGGLYIMRDGDLHLTVRAGKTGQDGMGGHAHNDALSVTLYAYGQTFLIDPGSYLYTSDPAARNAFRSTAYHNTLQVGSEEINPLPQELFALPDAASVIVHRWETGSEHDMLDVSHSGYSRLSPGVIHRRKVWFDKVERLWLLCDELLPVPGAGEAAIPVTLWFHFAPLPVSLDENMSVRAGQAGGPGLVVKPLGAPGLAAILDTGWYAPRYGIKREAPVAKYTGYVKLPTELTVVLYPYQNQLELISVERAGRTAQTRLGQMLR